jgi:hypothetical protein
MKSKIFLVIALLISSVTFAESVDEIVKKHLDAIGGEKKLDQLKTLKLTGSIEIAPETRAPFVMMMKDKTKMRFELDVQGIKMITALEGDSGWKVIPFMGKPDAERMSPDELKDAKKQADFTSELYNYKAKGSTVELIGKEDMEGTESYKLKVNKKNGDVIYLYLDATSFLELKQTIKYKMEDKEIESSTYSSNYKDVSGYKFPFTYENRSSDEASSGQSLNIDSIFVNPPIDDKLFVMPPPAPVPAPAPGVVK